MKKLLENSREDYEKFFTEFGKIVKEGLHTDRVNCEKLKDIVLYESMNTEAGKFITLKEYVDAMPESQEDIYYITGDKRSAVASSPALEYYRSKGYDVLFMTDPIDEWVMQSMFQYLKKSFKPVSKGEFEEKLPKKENVKKSVKVLSLRRCANLLRFHRYGSVECKWNLPEE